MMIRSANLCMPLVALAALVVNEVAGQRAPAGSNFVASARAVPNPNAAASFEFPTATRSEAFLAPLAVPPAAQSGYPPAPPATPSAVSSPIAPVVPGPANYAQPQPLGSTGANPTAPSLPPAVVRPATVNQHTAKPLCREQITNIKGGPLLMPFVNLISHLDNLKSESADSVKDLQLLVYGLREALSHTHAEDTEGADPMDMTTMCIVDQENGWNVLQKIIASGNVDALEKDDFHIFVKAAWEHDEMGNNILHLAYMSRRAQAVTKLLKGFQSISKLMLEKNNAGFLPGEDAGEPNIHIQEEFKKQRKMIEKFMKYQAQHFS